MGASVQLAMAVLVAVLALPLTSAAAAPEMETGAETGGETGFPAGVKVYVEAPGVYAVPLAELREVSGGALEDVPPGDLRLTYRGEPVPFWLEAGEGGTGGHGPGRLVFLAGSDLFRPTEPRETRPLVVLLLTAGAVDGVTSPRATDAVGSPAPTSPSPADLEPATLETATVHRRLLLEEDVLRVPLTGGDDEALESLWSWALLSQQSSSRHTVSLGDLGDRAPGESLDLEVTVGLLGWSRSPTPEGVHQHQVDVSLDDTVIGTARWNGRRTYELAIRDVPPDLLEEGPHELQLKVPRRVLAGAEEALIDVVYVDRIEVRYRAAGRLDNPAAPLLLAASSRPRWLPGAARPADGRLYATAGWSAGRRGGGWVLPSTPATELWVLADEGLRAPAGVEPLTPGARDLPADLEYVMLAPPGLLAGAERLAAFHRRRGVRVAVVDANAAYDGFGWGERSAAAIRRFLSHQYERTGALRWVLLVGDADWFQADDRRPYLHPEPVRRNRVPTWTYLSEYGPAASDHFYAMDPLDPAVPRFAVGRLPVVDAGELDRLVTKLLTQGSRPRDAGKPTALLLSDRSRGSLVRRERLRHRLQDVDLGVRFAGGEVEGGEVTDEDVLQALEQRPWLVYFGGHGSRHLWQLGDPKDPRPETFFDREDVQRLASGGSLPIVLSISCATAPFDHPSAASLGEVMVLEEGRGAAAFIGASATLFTPRPFGESLVRALLREETLGDALVEAKRHTATERVSHLYSLLGDPALPLASDDERRTPASLPAPDP